MRLTIDANADDMILAVRAAKKLAETVDSNESLVCFEGGAEFYVRRLKAGYSVKQVAPQVTNGE
jgi:tRNA A37 N6-isopentenylltransferase MiaA